MDAGYFTVSFIWFTVSLRSTVSFNCGFSMGCGLSTGYRFCTVLVLYGSFAVSPLLSSLLSSLHSFPFSHYQASRVRHRATGRPVTGVGLGSGARERCVPSVICIPLHTCSYRSGSAAANKGGGLYMIFPNLVPVQRHPLPYCYSGVLWIGVLSQVPDLGIAR